MKNRFLFAALGLLLVALHPKAESASTSVEVEAILGQSAVLLIDGERKMLRTGQSHAGVTLVAAQPTSVTLNVNGTTETVGLSQRVATRYEELQERVVTIARDARMQYQTNAIINGHSALVLVDTGANTVAISSQQADAMHIDYYDGTPSQVETASGMTMAYAVTLQSVSVGGIQVQNVPALVLEGAYPITILLGMSYLRHVKLQEHNGILSLSRAQ
ncbi:MAG: retropepsin-like aspartic protease [Halioglobus sp.]